MNCSQSSYNFLPKERNSNMDNQVHNQIVSFIWGIADDCLRDIYVRGKYRDVILPMTVIRRLDAMLEDSKAAVLDMKKKLDAAGIDNQWPALCNVAGQAFCNASPFRLKDLTSRAKKQTLQKDFEAYLDGFSPNVQEILAKFKFRDQIPTMIEADILGAVIEKFVSPDINLSPKPVYKDEAQTILKNIPAWTITVWAPFLKNLSGSSMKKIMKKPVSTGRLVTLWS